MHTQKINKNKLTDSIKERAEKDSEGKINWVY